MTTPDEIRTLIADLESAERGSRELSDRVLLALGWARTPKVQQPEYSSEIAYHWFGPDAFEWKLPAPDVTRSLDACAAAMPDGWAWMLGCAPGEQHFAEMMTTEESGKPEISVHSKTATAELAWSAANLRVRLAELENTT